MIKNKKGDNILTEPIIFLVLNLIFFSALIGSLFVHGGTKVVLERNYAKQIALLIDSSEPDTDIILNIAPLLNKKDKNFPAQNVINIPIGGNRVYVKLGEKRTASYNFFSDVTVSGYPNKDDLKRYIIVIRKKNA